MEKTPDIKEVMEYRSPKWNNNTKLVVALSFVAILAGIFVKFRNYIGPLLLAFILSYLMYPLIVFMHRRLRLSWRLAVLVLYLVIALVIIGLVVWGGIALVEQIQSLIRFLQTLLVTLPAYINNLSREVVQIGPFEIDLQTLDLREVYNQVISFVQPLMSQIGSFVGSIASGAATGIGWVLFILLTSFFMVSETGGNVSRLIDIEIPGYAEDTHRIRMELKRIWNAFLRNQLILISMTIILYSILLGALQVRFFFGLAILAGLARFVPYLGPAVAWTTYGLVVLFQGYTIFGLTPFWYAVLVIGLAIIVDTTIDNAVTPALMADALKVHPAAVMVAVLVAAGLLGVVGVLLAAPVLASAKLIGGYALDKLFDLDPWEGFTETSRKPAVSKRTVLWVEKLSNLIKGITPNPQSNDKRRGKDHEQINRFEDKDSG